MATMQIAKTKGAETVTKTTLTQRQSLEVVQIMLHGALSSITNVRQVVDYRLRHRRSNRSRSLFPKSAYAEQIYESNDSIIAYEDYIVGNIPRPSMLPDTRWTRMQVLRRGRSKRVDEFLRWLEVGPFAELKKKNLNSFKVLVHPNPELPNRVLETYTFSISYTPASDGDHEAAATSKPKLFSQSQRADIRATHDALQRLMRETMQLCGNIPELPPARFMTMTVDCVRGLSKLPERFVSNEGPDRMLLSLPSAGGWEMCERNLGTLASNHHGSSFHIVHLQPPNYDLGFYNDIDVALPRVPIDLVYATLRSNDESDQDQQVIELPETSPVQKIDLGPCEVFATPSTVIDDGDRTISTHVSGHATMVRVEESQDGNGVGQSNSHTAGHSRAKPQLEHDRKASRASQHLLSQFEKFSVSQSSNVPEMRGSLKDMMQPEYFTQGDTQTQGPFELPPPSPTYSMAHASRRSDLVICSPRSNASPPASRLQGKCEQQLRSDVRRRPQNNDQNANNATESISCQCGYDKEEADMVQCGICKTWQHLCCYGYTGSRDERLPQDHNCYECLFADGEQETLSALKDLAMKRRAMDIVLSDGLRTPTALAQTMGIDTCTAKIIHAFLKKEGFVIAVSGSRARGFSATGKPMFHAVRSGSNYDKMLAQLFDPQLRLPSLGKAADAKDRTASSTLDMPPPITPATRSRQNVIAKTPASGLDLRDSATPFGTPRRPSSSMKRMFEDEMDVYNCKAVTPGYWNYSNDSVKRFKSVRTEQMLDANGVSSPIQDNQAS